MLGPHELYEFEVCIWCQWALDEEVEANSEVQIAEERNTDHE